MLSGTSLEFCASATVFSVVLDLVLDVILFPQSTVSSLSLRELASLRCTQVCFDPDENKYDRKIL